MDILNDFDYILKIEMYRLCCYIFVMTIISIQCINLHSFGFITYINTVNNISNQLPFNVICNNALEPHHETSDMSFNFTKNCCKPG